MADSGKDKVRTAPAVPLSVLSDAGAWLVRLSGPLRNAAAEQGFQQWLRENPLHRLAFQQVSAEWDEADRLKRFTDIEIRVPSGEGAQARRYRDSFVSRPVLAVAAVFMAVAVGGLFLFLRAPRIATGINELRVVTLDDGSRVHLNTATHITVAYDSGARHIRLDRGEALFEVAKQSGRPFVVEAGDRQVRALGTAFLVRRDAGRVAITLMEGEVAISGTAQAAGARLTPGERLTFTQTHAPHRDRPEVDKLLAWQAGKVAIDNLPLAEAIAEMNRYSATPLVLQQAQPADLLVSGVFIAGQSRSFARAIAESYGLEVVDRGDAITLAGVGRSVVRAP